jgi:signal transduction histidine kinase
MQSFKLLIFLFFQLIIFVQCADKHPYPAKSSDTHKQQVILDSLHFLDSAILADKVADNKKALLYAGYAVDLARSNSDNNLLARAYMMKGIAFYAATSDSAYYYYMQARGLIGKVEADSMLSGIYYNLATFHEIASDYKTAVTYYDSAIQNARQHGNFILLSNTFNALGNIKSLLFDTVNAGVLYDSAWYFAHKYGLQRQCGVALASRAQLEDDPEEAISILRQALEFLRREKGNEVEIASVLNNLGIRLTNPDSSIMCFREAVKCSGLSIAQLAAWNNMAYSYLDKGAITSAKECLLNHSIPLAELLHNYDWLSTLYDSYADVLQAERKPEQALESEKKAMAYHLKSDEHTAHDQVRLLSALLETRDRDLRINRQKQELDKKELSNRKLWLWLSIFIIGCILLLGMLYFRMQKMRLRLQANTITSARKIIDLEEIYKSRLAMELHDLANIFQYSILNTFEISKNSIANKDISFSTIVTEFTKRMRKMSHQLHTAAPGKFSLEELLNGYFNEIGILTSNRVTCTFGLKGQQFSKDKTLHVFRIVQELIANGLKHVDEGRIVLELSVADSLLVIHYEDAGPGFDPTKTVGSGLGITSIRERTMILNGKTYLESSVEEGTRWDIVIPLK